jgi:hypothetical protein
MAAPRLLCGRGPPSPQCPLGGESDRAEGGNDGREGNGAVAPLRKRAAPITLLPRSQAVWIDYRA